MGDKQSENHDSVSFSGKSSVHEVVVTGSKVKHNVFSGMVKLNNLEPDQTAAVQKYVSAGDCLEQVSIDFDLLRLLGGSKRHANMSLMKQYDSKKNSTTNKQQKSHRLSAGREGVQLLKEFGAAEPNSAGRHKKPIADYATSLFLNFGRHSFNETASKSQQFQVKRRSITKAGGLLAADKYPDVKLSTPNCVFVSRTSKSR